MSSIFVGSSSPAFQLANEEPLNILSIDPVFEPPDDELDTNRQKVFDPNRGNHQIQQERARGLLPPPAIQPEMGAVSLARIEAADQLPIRGGGFLEVQTGELTITDGEQDVTIDDDQEARIFSSEDGLKIKIDDKTVTFDRNSTLEINGEGRASIEGSGQFLTMEAGDELQLQANGEEGIKVQNLRSAESIVVDQGRAPFTVQAGPVTVADESGPVVEFQSGDMGRVSLNTENQVVLKNLTTGQFFQVEPNTGFRVMGEGRLDFSGPGEGFVVETDSLMTVFREDNGTLRLSIPDTAEEANVSDAEEPPKGEPPVQFQFFTNVETKRQQFLGQQLVVEPALAEKSEQQQEERDQQEDRNQSPFKQEEDNNQNSFFRSPFFDNENDNGSRFQIIQQNSSSFFGLSMNEQSARQFVA